LTRDLAWVTIALLTFLVGRSLRGPLPEPIVQRPLVRCGPETVQYTDTLAVKRGWVAYDTFTVNMHICHPIP